MALDFTTIAQFMPSAVPMVGTLGISFDEIGPERAVLHLPDQLAYHNHIGGPHAGAMFTLAETASGALVLGHFGDMLDVATPLAVEATIRYLKIAMGDVTATATMAADAAQLREAVMSEGGERPEWTVEVELTAVAPDGTVVQTGAMSVLWTLKRNRTSA